MLATYEINLSKSAIVLNTKKRKIKRFNCNFLQFEVSSKYVNLALFLKHILSFFFSFKCVIWPVSSPKLYF